ncbi:hypothetical protein MP228_001949 [Amoeboaphelidium protococcarum]|nr:hypothetical protein MP228_001949 [Amoeboaphelidium protococcarum]
MPSMKTPLYGLDRELAEKQDSKYDLNQEQDAKEWIENVLGEKVFTQGDFLDGLKDGVVLLKLLNKVVPNTAKINKSQMPFQQMENIANFLNKSHQLLGIPKHESFQTVDLYEKKNKLAVLLAIYSFARHSQKYLSDNGKPLLPQLGPKLADKHEVSFSDEQLNAGKNIPSQQSGYQSGKAAAERGATQSGINFGVKRQPVSQGSLGNLNKN